MHDWLQDLRDRGTGKSLDGVLSDCKVRSAAMRPAPHACAQTLPCSKQPNFAAPAPALWCWARPPSHPRAGDGPAQLAGPAPRSSTLGTVIWLLLVMWGLVMVIPPACRTAWPWRTSASCWLCSTSCSKRRPCRLRSQLRLCPAAALARTRLRLMRTQTRQRPRVRRRGARRPRSRTLTWRARRPQRARPQTAAAALQLLRLLTWRPKAPRWPSRRGSPRQMRGGTWRMQQSSKQRLAGCWMQPRRACCRWVHMPVAGALNGLLDPGQQPHGYLLALDHGHLLVH